MPSRKQARTLDPIFSPRSIAVIGASQTEGSVGRAVFNNILLGGFTGIVYPVNLKAHSVCGVRAYPSIFDISEKVDLAVVIVPAAAVPEVVEECGKNGVKGLVIISAGFKEVGKEGAELETETAAIAKKYSMRLIGPNCLGVINTDTNVRLNTSFATKMPAQGSIAFASQSGALCAAILDFARGEKIGFSKFVSMGNKADVSENDLLEYLGSDPQTRVILLYVEDIVDGRKFVEVASRITEQKPIIAVKAGVTPEGARAASSHTGALAGSDEAYDAILRQSGVLRVESVSDLFDYARAFAEQPLPKGNRVAIITNGGGPGIMATDACVRYGLQVAQFSETTKKRLRAGLPKAASVNNPVDIVGDAQADRYEVALRAALWDENVDCGLVMLTPQAMVDIKKIGETIATIAPKSGKTIVGCLMGLVDVSPGIEVLEKNGIPHYSFPEAAVRSLATLYNYQRWTERPRTRVKRFDVDLKLAKQIIARAKQAGETNLSQHDAMKVLEAYGLPIAKTEFAKTREEAVKSAKRIGFPVAMKIVSPEVVHKFDVGGVKLDLTSERDVLESFNEIMRNVKSQLPKAGLEGVVVQEHVRGGRETIVGMRRDPKFGPLLMFGLGGIYVEAYRDVSFRLAPVRELGAHNMISQIRGSKILEGFRGQPPSDIKALAECIERTSQLALELEEVQELDVNPLVAFEKGCRAVDARIIISE
ncbi:MAG TPA: acetate--CoA ligase family protein [Candidatus Bathyarchaeia archaeon]